MDVAAGGAFLSLTISDATNIVEKMATNQGWNEERAQPRKRGGGINQLKEGRHTVCPDGPADEEA